MCDKSKFSIFPTRSLDSNLEILRVFPEFSILALYHVKAKLVNSSASRSVFLPSPLLRENSKTLFGPCLYHIAMAVGLARVTAFWWGNLWTLFSSYLPYDGTILLFSVALPFLATSNKETNKRLSWLVKPYSHVHLKIKYLNIFVVFFSMGSGI